MWKILTKREVPDFERYGLKDYKVGDPINSTWHPVVQAICYQRNADHWKEEAKKYTEEVSI